MTGSPRFELSASHVALDLANTLDYREDPARRVDLLADYPDFLQFAFESGVITREQMRKLERKASTGEQTRALESARELREAIQAVFSAIARERTPPDAGLETLARFWRASAAHRRFENRNGELRWDWESFEENPESPVWPICFEAAALLTGPDVRFVRECENETCRWLFLDRSKNHSRRWCDMRVCGNREKAKRYYVRHSARESSND